MEQASWVADRFREPEPEQEQEPVETPELNDNAEVDDE
jgi:hypothetical protein